MAKWISKKSGEHEIWVDDVYPFKNENGAGIIISWSGNGVGFGDYTLFIEEDEISADSEHMDTNEDKSFLKALFEDIASKVRVTD